MSERTDPKFRPGLEPLEVKRPLSATPAAAAGAEAAAHVSAVSARAQARAQAEAAAGRPISAEAVKPLYGYLVFRITNPDQFNNKLAVPTGHVMVQDRPPVPGQVYNVLSVTVRNGSLQTFNAGSGLTVGLTDETQTFPILTGNEQWKPGQVFVFYILSKKYYPLKSQVTSGFVFNLGGAVSTAVPGPSGIFLRLKYNPDTIDQVLNHIVRYGQGPEGGSGIKLGLPVTSIYGFVPSATNRNDFGGYF